MMVFAGPFFCAFLASFARAMLSREYYSNARIYRAIARKP
jgi:hypothetical protein